jgi:aminoglycoside phosphotransferase (APT) family kinase protein
MLSVAPMGRSSTEMHAIDVRNGSGRILRLALRRYVDNRRLATDPWYRPAHEVTALGIVARAHIPAPRLIAEDVNARQCDVPAILETRISGRPLRRRPADMDRYLREAAQALHSIHAIDPVHAAALPFYAPYRPPSTLRTPRWSKRPALWVDVLDVLAQPAPPAEGRFIHRDYHPGNILVNRGRITGVVDWLTACRGPRSIDVARMRLNLAADFGLEEADRFLALYRDLAPASWSHDPHWDLLDAVDMAQDTPLPRTRRQAAAWDRFEWWVSSSLESLGARPSP